MKKYIVTVFIVLFTFSGLTVQEWNADFAKAKEIATAENKPIILVFQGSD